MRQVLKADIRHRQWLILQERQDHCLWLRIPWIKNIDYRPFIAIKHVMVEADKRVIKLCPQIDVQTLETILYFAVPEVFQGVAHEPKPGRKLVEISRALND